jgi:metal-dependent amidase/aminoacylase/carboxypeptidase family protein
MARASCSTTDLIDPLPDAAFALHIMPNAPHGMFTGRAGPLLASSDVLSIKVIGKGGHASMPHDAIDPIPVACEIVSAIQTMVTRKVSVFDPAVITIAKIEAGTTNNIIPETANLLGTIRTLSPHRRAHGSGRAASTRPGNCRGAWLRSARCISNRAFR